MKEQTGQVRVVFSGSTINSVENCMRLTRRAIISAIISMAYSFSSMLVGRRDHCMSSNEGC